MLRPKTVSTRTYQQVGPQGERAIGVTVAKKFDGVEFRGIVDSFRSARIFFYRHVTYLDGDEKELSQTKLRDDYLFTESF